MKEILLLEAKKEFINIEIQKKATKGISAVKIYLARKNVILPFPFFCCASLVYFYQIWE